MPSTTHFPPAIHAAGVRRLLLALLVGVALAAGCFSAAALFVGGLPVAGFVVAAATFAGFVFTQPRPEPIEQPGPAAHFTPRLTQTTHPLYGPQAHVEPAPAPSRPVSTRLDVDRTLTGIPVVSADLHLSGRHRPRTAAAVDAPTARIGGAR